MEDKCRANNAYVAEMDLLEIQARQTEIDSAYEEQRRLEVEYEQERTGLVDLYLKEWDLLVRQQEREQERFLEANSYAEVKKNWGWVSALQVRAQIRLAGRYSRAFQSIYRKYESRIIKTRFETCSKACSFPELRLSVWQFGSEQQTAYANEPYAALSLAFFAILAIITPGGIAALEPPGQTNPLPSQLLALLMGIISAWACYWTYQFLVILYPIDLISQRERFGAAARSYHLCTASIYIATFIGMAICNAFEGFWVATVAITGGLFLGLVKAHHSLPFFMAAQRPQHHWPTLEMLLGDRNEPEEGLGPLLE